MAIHRGIQSALFYYLSCAPCADARYRKRRKQEAALSRAERLALEEEETNVYRHPGEPSSTNPHWQSEIDCGPTLVRKGRKKVHAGDGKRSMKAGRVSSNASHITSSVDLQHGIGTRANSRCDGASQQLADGDPWAASRGNLDSSLYAESIQMPPKARTVNSATSSTYHCTRNPPINEMHPATVTKVNTREDVMWMMQPLPVAEVMSGKRQASRGRSTSGASRLNTANTAMSRQHSMTMTEQKTRTGSRSATPMSRQSSNHTLDLLTRRHDDSRARAFSMSPPRERRRVVNLRSTRDESDECGMTVVCRPEMALLRPQPRRTCPRPALSTIVSDNDIVYNYRLSGRAKGKTFPTPPNSTDGHSEQGDFVAPAISLNDKALAGGMTQRKVIQTGSAHKHKDSELSIRPELFDSWYTPEFELPKWIAEHTKREVRERWSMDL